MALACAIGLFDREPSQLDEVVDDRPLPFLLPHQQRGDLINGEVALINRHFAKSSSRLHRLRAKHVDHLAGTEDAFFDRYLT